MPKPIHTYQFPTGSKAWRNALETMEQYLPSNLGYNIQALKQLPVFAVVVVVDNANLGSLDNANVNELLQTWVAEQRGWAIQAVVDDTLSVQEAQIIQTKEELADVSVFRYLLVPTDAKLMHADKREAVAHIIDEQLTAYLKKTLRPKPNYNFQVDAMGQVADFDPTKAPKRHSGVDVHILSISQMLRRHKLVCFDMDSTLIEQEVIVELARICGVEKRVADITEQAMRGEIAFSESFAKRVALLEGVDVAVVDQIIKENITFSAGAFTLINALKAKGCRTVLVSGGFLPFAKHVAMTLGMDDYYANPLVSTNGKLTGTVGESIIDGKGKARIVARLADEMSIDMEEVVCVGDGANDLPMMSISDVGVAYRAKPIVQVKADAAVNITGLEGVLYALGHRLLN